MIFPEPRAYQTSDPANQMDCRKATAEAFYSSQRHLVYWQFGPDLAA